MSVYWTAILFPSLSPSSRRAWIEINLRTKGNVAKVVALLTEGVDRNASVKLILSRSTGRPPHGGRG